MQETLQQLSCPQFNLISHHTPLILRAPATTLLCSPPPHHPTAPTARLQAFPRAASSSTFVWKIPRSPQYPAQQSVPPGSLPCTPPPPAQPSVLPQALVLPSDRTDHTPGPPSTLCNTIPTSISRQQFLLVSPFPIRKQAPQDSDRLPPPSKPERSSAGHAAGVLWVWSRSGWKWRRWGLPADGGGDDVTSYWER